MADTFRESLLPLAIIDNMAFSSKDVWAWYRIQNDPFDFLSVDQKIQWGASLNGALNALMGDREESLDIRFVSTTAPVDINAWEIQMRSIAAERKAPAGFDNFIARQAGFLRQKEYMTRVSYLGVHLGRRGALDIKGLNPFESGVRGAIEVIKDWGSRILQTKTGSVDAFEEKMLRAHEKEIHRTLSTGALGAKRCSSEELVLNLIKKPFYPAMPAPMLDIDIDNRVGTGDIAYEATSVIENNHRYLKMSQVINGEEVEGYRSTMVFERFPSQMMFPVTYPFLAFPTLLGAAFTIYGHCTLVSSNKMKKEIEKKRLEAKDEIANISAATSDLDNVVGTSTSAEVSGSLQDLNMISEMVAQDSSAWCYGNYRLVLEADSPDTIHDFASLLQQAYGDMDIRLRVASGAQLRLLQEQMPTSGLIVKSFQQITSLTMLSTSGFNIASIVGDEIYQGR